MEENPTLEMNKWNFFLSFSTSFYANWYCKELLSQRKNLLFIFTLEMWIKVITFFSILLHFMKKKKKFLEKILKVENVRSLAMNIFQLHCEIFHKGFICHKHTHTHTEANNVMRILKVHKKKFYSFQWNTSLWLIIHSSSII